jgi:hypothetical protein
VLRERDSRATQHDEVLATLAELDEKLEALERGMAAARGGAARALDAEGAAAAARTEAKSSHAVADFQAAARSRGGRRLWREATREGELVPADLEPSPTAGVELPPPPTGGPAALDTWPADPAGPAGPVHGGPDADAEGAPPAPDVAIVVDPVATPAGAEPEAVTATVTVTAGELAGWQERLGRAVEQLATLQAEIESAATRAAASPGQPTRPAVAEASRGPAGPEPAGSHAGPSEGPGSPTAAPSRREGSVPEPTAGSTTARLPVPMPHDRIFEGRVLVDAGPFLDIAAVTAFQQALERVPGARDVDVTALELDRAHVELDLSDPVALGREIRAVFPFNFAIFEAGHGRLSINVDVAPAAAPQHASASR